ncbi:Hypothetical predicted protein, partial [Pelobates cultripes]
CMHALSFAILGKSMKLRVQTVTECASDFCSENLLTEYESDGNMRTDDYMQNAD